MVKIDRVYWLFFPSDVKVEQSTYIFELGSQGKSWCDVLISKINLKKPASI